MKTVSHAVYDSAYLGGIISAIEDRAYDCGTVNLNVRRFARENGYLSRDQFGNLGLTLDDLQEIADIFCDNFDVRAF